jgi:hypothetical protein
MSQRRQATVKRAALAFIGAVIAVGLASAQGAPNAPLSAAALRAEVFGVRLSGVTMSSGLPWSECISPQGETLYRFDGQVSVGQAWVTGDDQLCFRYGADQPPACFRATRNGSGLIFWGGQDGVFIANRIERSVTACNDITVPMS